MRLARILTADGPKPAVLDGEEWAVVRDLFAEPLERTGERHPAGTTPLLAPVEPRVILGLAHNSSAADRQLPPQAFHKSARTATAPGDPIVLDEGIGTVVVEGELALVIGRTARHLTPENALAHVLGFTIGNDVTAVDQIALDDKLLQAKNGDGYTPIGPWIETALAVDAPHAIEVRIGGAVQAHASTADLGWNVVEQLVYITSTTTLGPGDVILTGAPNTSAPTRPGDRVAITIEGIGTLENEVVAGRRRAALPAA
ncbi:fumarylacetoacetate hydrolase family protein [Herbiconiux sp. 11R-BC]|uniref:fumarylacetoacetate hydrolase family protein n=1 Tax=Herbiconiux sp. 11R-BC TaxID=3111637 RepID=UPI003C0A28B4